MQRAPISTIMEDVADFLASSPTSEQIIAYKAPENLDQRLHYLLDQNSSGEITRDERAELDDFMQMNRFLKLLKLKMRIKLAEEL
jgi:hypothetical protein